MPTTTLDLSGAGVGGHVPSGFPSTDVLGFSSADFEDGDAGSGPGSGLLRNIQTSIQNVLQFHTNMASGIVPDERDYLRPWTKKIQTILANETELMTTFLEKPLADTSLVQRHDQFLRSLDSSTFNSHAAWLKERVEPQFDTEAILTEINVDLGMPLAELTASLHKVMDLYANTLTNMFHHVKILTFKLDNVENLKKRLLSLSLNDGESEELLALKQSIVAYVQAEYEKNRIQEDYQAFCKYYARFMALRSVLTAAISAANVGSTSAQPICTICTEFPISMALVPCGHTFCQSCCQQQRFQCFVCRTTLTTRLRLYFV